MTVEELEREGHIRKVPVDRRNVEKCLEFLIINCRSKVKFVSENSYYLFQFEQDHDSIPER